MSLEGVFFVLWAGILSWSDGLNLSALMIDLFLKNMQLWLHKVLIDGLETVVLIIMFLSAVWTAILTAPIHCRWSIGVQVM